MNVTYLDETTEPAWTEYVDAHPDATFYHRHEWRTILERSFGHKSYYQLAIDPDGLVRGVLPIVHVKSRLFGSTLCSMPFLNFGGIVSDNLEAEKALLGEARRLLETTEADYLEFRHLKKSHAELPVKTHKTSMTLELEPDPEVHWKRLKSKVRREVRKGISSGLEVRFGRGELVEAFYGILSQGWRDLGTPIYRRSFFENVIEVMGDSVEITLVLHEGKPVAAAFDGFFRDTVEGMWTYSLREYHRLNSNYFLYWHLIKRACERGYRRFHLGRSTVDSTGETYKRKWNAESRQLYWEYLLGRRRSIPELNVQNPTYRLAIGLWRKLPVRVTRWIGPPLAKNIP